MSDAITIRKNGQAEYAGRAGTNAWHGLGSELPEGASMDQWIVTAGLDWRVQRSKVRYAIERNGASVKEFPEQHVLFRSDSHVPLAVVSERFNVVQPAEVAGFFRDLCEYNGFTMRTMGTLFGGRKLWALADIGAESYVINPADKVKGRLLLVTANDGTMSTVAKFVSECVVCANTLAIAMGETGGSLIKVSHKSVFDAKAAKIRLGVDDGQFGQFIQNVRRLGDKFVTAGQADAMTLQLYQAPGSGSEVANETVRETRGYKRIMDLFSGNGIAQDMSGRKNTAWGWLNAVTEYVDHHIAARSADNRLNSSQFGAGDALKTKACELAYATL